MEPLLNIKDLHVEYETGNKISYALNGVDLTIMPGEAMGLVGETGAGKTTTALSILKLLPPIVSTITKGEIMFDGEPILHKSEGEMTNYRGKRIAMIFSNPLSSLNPVYTVGTQITLALASHENLRGAPRKEKAADLLRMVGIPANRMDDYPHQLSGGMRQRVGIAAALACNPELLVADEPTTALDVTIQAQILEIMKDLQKARMSSLLMITHSLGIIAEICQRVAVMYSGAIVESGTVKEVFTNPAHPYTIGLLAAIPRIDGKRDRLSHIPGNVVNAQNLPTGCRFHPRCLQACTLCKKEYPPLADLGNGHMVACWKRSAK